MPSFAQRRYFYEEEERADPSTVFKTNDDIEEHLKKMTEKEIREASPTATNATELAKELRETNERRSGYVEGMFALTFVGLSYCALKEMWET